MQSTCRVARLDVQSNQEGNRLGTDRFLLLADAERMESLNRAGGNEPSVQGALGQSWKGRPAFTRVCEDFAERPNAGHRGSRRSRG